MRQVGLLDYWERRFWPRPNRCSEPLINIKPAAHTKLTLNYLLSAFLLLGFGLAVSFIVFLFEVVVSKF